MTKAKEQHPPCQAMAWSHHSYYRCGKPGKHTCQMQKRDPDSWKTAGIGEPVEVHLCGIHSRKSLQGDTLMISVGTVNENGQRVTKQMVGMKSDENLRREVIENHNAKIRSTNNLISSARLDIDRLFSDRRDALRNTVISADPIFASAYKHLDDVLRQLHELQQVDPLAGTVWEGTDGPANETT